MALSPRFRKALVVTATLGAVLPSSAVAGQSYEQVSRTSGPYETALVADSSSASAVGDVGRFAGFRATFPDGQSGAFVRDIRSNLTTQPGGAATKQIWGFDRAETKALIAREIGGKVELRIAPLVGGGTSKLIYSTTGAYYYGLQAALSGDGSTVVASDWFAGRVVKINVATGAVTQLQTTDRTNANAWELGPQSISDDGKTVVIGRPYLDAAGKRGGRLYRDGFPVVELGEPAVLSPDGSTVAYAAPYDPNLTYRVVVRKTATGATKTWATDDWGQPWISSDGAKLAISQSGRVFELDTATGVVGAPGPSIGFGYTGLRSPSGRFSLGSVLIDTTGADLLGASDPVSADFYLKLGATYNCRTFGKNYGTVNVTLLSKPLSFAPKSVTAEVKLYVDVSLLKTATIPVSTSTSAPFTGNPTYYRVEAKVTDELGRVTTGSLKYRFAGCA